LMDAVQDSIVTETFSDLPDIRFLRGNRFLIMQGTHTKATSVPLILDRFPERTGPVIGAGDSPNDVHLLMAADIPVVVAGPGGVHPVLKRSLPFAHCSTLPHGRGFAEVIEIILKEQG
jgi:phosphoserine phosphatase